MDARFQRDLELRRLTDTSTGDWIEAKGRSREAVFSFRFGLGQDEFFILGTMEVLDSAVVPTPIRWDMALNQVRKASDPNVIATLSDEERSSITDLLVEHGPSFKPLGGRTEVAFVPSLIPNDC